MAYSLSPWLKPRFFITGTNRPLAGGLMYTYKAGTTDPATTYSDDAGTTNTNPIQLDSDGQCDLYLDDAVSYRIILKNSAGVTQFDKDRIASLGSTQVQSFDNIAALRLRSGTTTANAAKTLGYYSAGDGGANAFYWDGTSVATDNGGTIIKPTSVSGAGRWLAVDAYTINVRQFGAKGDGVTDDTAAIQAALDAIATASGGILVFDGAYRLTENSGAGTQTRLTVSSSNVTLIFSERTKFLIKSDGAITNAVILNGVSNVRLVGTLRVESDASTPYSTTGAYGAKALVILNKTGETCENIEIDAVHITRGSGGVFIQNAAASSNRVQNVRIGKITTIDATYGLNSQDNGDNVTFELIETRNAYRSLFVYGVKNYSGRVNAINQYASGTPVNISQYSVAEGGSGVNTSNIDVTVSIDGGTPSVVATVRHIGDGGSSQEIDNVHIRFVGPLVPSVGLSLANFGTSGGAASSTPFSAKINNVVFTSDCTRTLFTNAITHSPCAWVTRPTVFWVGAASMSISNLLSVVGAVNVTNSRYGGEIVGSGGITLINNSALSGLTTGGVVSNLARIDGSSNNIYGEPSAEAIYSMIHCGTNGFYVNVDGASRFQFTSSALRPFADNVYSLGIASQRYSVVYAGTGTINTSDGREKQQVRYLLDAERAVAVRLKGMIRAFKFSDAVEKKGDDARIHFGVIAQDVQAAFYAEGLNPLSYAMLCYDEWTEQLEERDEDGNVVREYCPAGDRYGIRYDELLAFIISAL